MCLWAKADLCQSRDDAEVSLHFWDMEIFWVSDQVIGAVRRIEAVEEYWKALKIAKEWEILQAP